jgi:hypothetical protein
MVCAETGKNHYKPIVLCIKDALSFVNVNRTMKLSCGGCKMETAATWLRLAAHATRIANEMPDSYSRAQMREIAVRYEALAKYAGRLGRHSVAVDYAVAASAAGDRTRMADGAE